MSLTVTFTAQTQKKEAIPQLEPVAREWSAHSCQLRGKGKGKTTRKGKLTEFNIQSQKTLQSMQFVEKSPKVNLETFCLRMKSSEKGFKKIIDVSEGHPSW